MFKKIRETIRAFFGTKYEIFLYKDVKGEWRWRFVAPNGEIVAISSEGYTRKANAKRAIEIVSMEFARAKIFSGVV